MQTMLKCTGLFAVLVMAMTPMSQAQLRVDHLFCENLSNPLGLDVAVPRLTWQLLSPKNGVMQTAYELRVTKGEAYGQDARALLWNSGKVRSDSSVHVTYKGPQLQSDTRYYWQVRVWDNKGQVSGWSEPAFWQMGLLEKGDWKAQWIEQDFPQDALKASPLFRKTFSISKRVKSATAYITCHGIYEAFLNGVRLGGHFSPGWTDYYLRLQYQAYDVTASLVQGENTIGVMLGGGWHQRMYSKGEKLSLLCQVAIHYADGTTQLVTSDDSWSSSTGVVRSVEVLDGGVFDLRMEKKGWTTPKYDAAGWSGVTVVEDTSKVRLIGNYGELVREHENLKGKRLIVTPKGERVIDFGQMLAGWERFSVNGRSGDSVRIHHAAVLDKEGNFYTANLYSDHINTYVLSGNGEETCEPHFTYAGFRYIKVESYPGELKPENFTAVAVYSDLVPTGTFSCSDSLVNRLQQNIQWTQKATFMSLPTACCDRDERTGWTDTKNFSRIAAFNMRANNFYASWLTDLSLDQRPDGMITCYAPNVSGAVGGLPGWGDAITIVPWNMYLTYGDKRILEANYPSMIAWLGWMEKNTEDYLYSKGIPWWYYADWLHYEGEDPSWAGWGPPAPTDPYFIAQCYYGRSLQLVIKIAGILGRIDDVARYTAVLENVKKAFLKEYTTPNGRLTPNTQTAYVLALHFDMLPEALRAQAARRLVENLTSYRGHFTCGELGVQYIAPVLSRFGYADTAYHLLLQKSYPSWLYPVTRGATTLWERWDTIRPDSTFANPVMNSFNLPAMGGSVADWLYREVAGLDCDPEQGAGYKRLRIRPTLPSQFTDSTLSYARASLETYYGRVASGWEHHGDGTLTLRVEIPPNTRATVYVPAKAASSVSESGQKLSKSSRVQVVGREAGYVVVNVGSGAYQLSVRE